jgi:hypothetical protein
MSIKMGRFQTLIGAEEFRQDRNYNVTRGLLWALQPNNHTGATIGSDYDNGITWTVGVANSYSSTMADTDHEKTFIGQLGYRGESFSLLLNGLYGGNASDFNSDMGCLDEPWSAWESCEGKDSDQVALLDLVATWDPIESISTWINFDYYWFNNAGSVSQLVDFPGYDWDRNNVYGISTGIRWGFLENTGAALRFEWLRSEYHPYDFWDGDADCCDNFGQDLNLFSLTGTIDHALTDNLTVRVEGRYDWGNDSYSKNNLFTSARPADYDAYSRKDQGMGLIELMYRF